MRGPQIADHDGSDIRAVWPFRAFADPRATVAALYVETGGCYFGQPGVDPWDEQRDARKYRGPYPVVAHPPCQRWGKYWAGSPTVISRTGKRLVKGDDVGCFEAALSAVRQWGGVIEHPADSYAWKHFGLNLPPQNGGWVVADWQGGWTCCVEQGAYGHLARKATWLYVSGIDHADLPMLEWGKTEGEFLRLESGYHSAEERARKKALHKHHGAIELLSHKARAATPIPFRELLLSIARKANARPGAERALALASSGDGPVIDNLHEQRDSA